MDADAKYDGGKGWNREHVWAKSYGDFGTRIGAGTDVHHIRAEDVSTNSARNNRSFDESDVQYIDGSGTYQGPTNSYTSTTAWTWEPRDEVKGINLIALNEYFPLCCDTINQKAAWLAR